MESCWNSSTGVSSNSTAYAIAIFECSFLLPPKTKNSNVAKPPRSLVASPCFVLTGCSVKQAPLIAITSPKGGQRIVTALLAARNADVDALTKMAA
jgi:hypothetical protein